MLRHSLLLAKKSGIAAIVASLASTALGQEISTAERFEEAVLVVSPRTTARDRVDDTAPVLSYGIEFFQRFEPANLGEMLRRVPGLYIDSLYPNEQVFADTESEFFGFRGIFGGSARGAGQVLINGRRVPGFGADGTLSFSAIPFELVKEIQVIRNATVDVDQQGYGLTVNVILRDGKSIPREKLGTFHAIARTIGDESGFAIGGGLRKTFGEKWLASLHFNFDDSSRPTGSEDKETLFPPDDNGFPDPDSPETRIESVFQNVANIEQSGVNFIVERSFEERGHLQVMAHRFDRARTDAGLETINPNTDETSFRVFTNIDDVDLQGASSELKLNFGELLTSFVEIQASFDSTVFEYQIKRSANPDLPLFGQFDDREHTRFSFMGAFNESSRYKLKVGGIWHDESISRKDFFQDVEALGGARDVIFQGLLAKQTLSLYGMFDFQIHPDLNWNIGVRNDTVTTEKNSTQVTGPSDRKINEVLPSSHLWWRINDSYDLRLAYSKALAFQLDYALIPELADFGDDGLSLSGDDTDAIGFDKIELSFDYHFADRQGILGLSAFAINSDRFFNTVESIGVEASRAIVNSVNPELVDEFDSAVEGLTDDEVVLEYFTVSDNPLELKGVELDLSLPLILFGLPEVALSMNYSIYDRSGIGFNDERTHSSNITLDHQLTDSFAYGLSYNRKGDETIASENDDFVNTRIFSREPSLDLFIEKRFGDYFLARLVVENALDSESTVSSEERFRPLAVPNEIDINSTSTDPSIQLVFRGAF